LRCRIARLQHDNGAAKEIASQADPLAALAAAASILIHGDKPIAFNGGLIAEKIGVGRACSLDDANPGQKIDPAARSVNALSGPISK
jgi:hypothetical protein